MSLELKEIHPRNFRCFDDRVFKFSHNTVVRGTNGAGKSTLFDAFVFTLFGKDSNGRTDFGYKRRDADGNIIHELEYGCEVVLDFNGTEKRFERVVVEKWVKPRGSDKKVLSGNECAYFVDRVRCATKKEYDAAVSSIVSEDVMRIMTDVYYFMSQKDDYKKSMLLKLAYGTENADKADEIVMQEVLQSNQKFRDFVDKLNGIPLREFNSSIAAKIKSINFEIEGIPTKIAAKKEAMPPEEDWIAIQTAIEENRLQLREIDNQIADENAKKSGETEAINKLKSEVSNKQLELLQRENAIRSEVMNAESGKRKALDDADAEYTSASKEYNRNSSLLNEKKREIAVISEKYEKQIAADNGKIAELNQKAAAMREQYKAIKNDTYNYADDELRCPTCHRPYDFEKLKEQKLLENVNIGKHIVNVEIVQLREEIEILSQKRMNDVSTIEREIEDLESKMKRYREIIDASYKRKQELAYQPTDVNGLIANDATCETIRNQIASLKDKIATSTVPQLDSSLHSIKRDIEAKIESLSKQLGAKEIIDRVSQQIGVLEEKRDALNKELADLEYMQDTAKEFQMAKDKQLLDKVNRLFSIVTWDFVSEQYNGNDKIGCNCYVDGIPYAEKNHAGKVNAGLDIINAIGRAEHITMPIFIDNAESVVDYIQTDSQKILLMVDASAKELIFEM